MIGRVGSCVPRPTVWELHEPPVVRTRKTTSGLVPVRLVLTTQNTRPLESGLRFMWSSATLLPGYAPSGVAHVRSAAASSWIAKKSSSSDWLLQKTPILLAPARIVDTSSPAARGGAGA